MMEEQKQAAWMEDASAKAPAEVPKKEKSAKKLSPKAKKRLKRLAILLIVVAALGILLSRCAASSREMISSTYIPAAVTRQDLTVSVSGTGTIEAAKSSRVTALVAGEILEANFEEGDVVQKGDVLYRIDSSDVQSSVEQARIALEQAHLNHGDSVTLTADSGGIVERLHVKVGDTVTPGALVAEVTQRENVSLKVPFLSQDAKLISVGQSAAVTVNGYADTLTGRVVEVSGADLVDAGGAFVRNVRVELDNPGGITDQMQGSAVIDGRSCSAMGAFSYASASRVTAKAGGTVTALYVSEGDRVSSRQTLGALGDTSSAAAAALSLELAELNYANALDRLADYTITAPISGEVVEKVYQVGDKLDNSAMSAATGSKSYMAVLYDMSALEFELNIDELDINRVLVGQKVAITAKAAEGEDFVGSVTKVNINGTTVNGRTTYPVVVQVDGVPESLLPGMNVSAEILVEQVTDVLCIPVDAVRRGNLVEVPLAGAMTEDGTGVADITKIEEREISLGRSNEEYIEVTQGLNEGDPVLIRNQASSMMQAMMGMGG